MLAGNAIVHLTLPKALSLGYSLISALPFSLLGGVIVIIGLYLLLWGKERDQPYIKTQEQPSSHCDGLKVIEEDLTLGESEVP